MNNSGLQSIANGYWDEFCEVYPKLVKFDYPTVTFNNRLTRAAGYCYTEENKIELSSKLYIKFPNEIIVDTLKHELAHQIDHNLNGWYKRKPHHGKAWAIIMVELGLIPDPYTPEYLKL